MAAIEWNDGYAVGISEVDAHHKSLFERVNELNEALVKGAGKDALGPTLSFLGEYVVMHFQAEQRIMEQHGYPGLAQHAREHDEFVRTYLDAKAKFAQDGSTRTLAAVVNCTVCKWLLAHVLGSDRKMGHFLRAKGCC